MKGSAVLFSFLIFTHCQTGKPIQKQTMQTFDREGHRGCRGLMPENTIAAMKKAVDLNVTTLEMDAVMTKDGEVILSHEPFFNHEITTKPDGSFVKEEEEKSLNIYRMTYDEVKRYDVGLKPHPRFPQQEKTAAVKPLLRDLIDSIRLYCKEKNRPFPQWNIETKTQPQTDNLYHPAPAAFVEMLMKVIKEKGIEKNVIIQSFDFRTLQYLHQHYPHMRTAMLVEDYDKRTLDELLAALGFTPTIFSPAQSLVAKELVEACHQKKMQVIPWTVNETDEMQKLIALNVDGIITDYPNLFSQLAL
ncbi:glycerophosphodiester phosphodiesterase [Flavisolibacter ginsenosidimutans]|uniref:Glycerophosphodiester phosphodiesterase n=2 Tax=Flavisolibacter ginsenosidimutans TaxID=661481 RepID=A0A5B8UP37_9BACT|nr:glycerophosphodiester phosphodiesterase [Flavisolibacter ginsenosidimutans]